MLGGAAALALLLAAPVSAIAATHSQPDARNAPGTGVHTLTTQTLAFAGAPLTDVALRREHGRGETGLSVPGRAAMEQAGIVLWDEGRPAGGGRGAYSSSTGVGNLQSSSYQGSR